MKNVCCELDDAVHDRFKKILDDMGIKTGYMVAKLIQEFVQKQEKKTDETTR